MTYRIGIMMIGSLYWDKDGTRVNWRKNRLSKEEYDIFAPIRYGRLSKKRGSTYTMVFSKLCARKSYGLGSAKVVTCKNATNNIDDIVQEAELLWAAEQKENKTNNRFWASWGSIGLLCNPTAQFHKDFFLNWSNIILNSNSYGNISHCKSEAPVLRKNGFLNLPWPISTQDKNPLPLDIILATATDPVFDPKSNAYPSVRKISEAWRKDTQNNVSYFWENRNHGIQTFQDERIINALK